MEYLVDFVMQGSVDLDAVVMIRFAIMLSLIELLSNVLGSFIKGVKK